MTLHEHLKLHVCDNIWKIINSSQTRILQPHLKLPFTPTFFLCSPRKIRRQRVQRANSSEGAFRLIQSSLESPSHPFYFEGKKGFPNTSLIRFLHSNESLHVILLSSKFFPFSLYQNSSFVGYKSRKFCGASEFLRKK